jgi:very-short-patch-repair endonuclease
MNLSSYPHLVKEWHPTKNGDLTPDDFTHGSRKKVWWLCPKGHSYQSKPNGRTAGKTGCSYCSGKKVSEENNLLSNFPKIAKEWHPTLNGDLLPNDVTFGTSKKIWWLCSNGHNFNASVNRRTSMKTNCPNCQGRKAGDDNNLSVVFPEIAKEWHPLMNGELKPEHYTRGSKKKVWWLCPKGHSYETTIKIRTIQKSGCTFCSRQSSVEELRILSELRWIFKEVNNRHKIDGKEVDIFIPSLNIGVEFDGSYWHKDKEEADLEKNKHLLSRGIKLIRVRQHPLKPLTENDIIVSSKQLIKEDVNKVLNTITSLIDDDNLNKINEYLDKPSFVNEELFREYKSYFPMPLPENSLAISHPLISAEWNYEKNYPLTPNDYSHGSSYKVWWKCSKGHEYEALIGNRARGTQCPYCSGRKSLNLDLF